MTEPVKPRRPYRSSHRQEQALQTRQRILEAANELFVEKGFLGTTITAVAKRSGASEETVYSIFSNKQGLLESVIRKAVIGDSDMAILDQSGPAAVRASSDQLEQLELFADDIVLRLERIGPLMEALSAAKSEPGLAALYEGLQRDRMRGLSAFVAALSANGPLSMETGKANETVWALASPELHRLLTHAGGWSRETYKKWLAETLAKTLLLAR